MPRLRCQEKPAAVATCLQGECCQVRGAIWDLLGVWRAVSLVIPVRGPNFHRESGLSVFFFSELNLISSFDDGCTKPVNTVNLNHGDVCS